MNVNIRAHVNQTLMQAREQAQRERRAMPIVRIGRPTGQTTPQGKADLQLRRPDSRICEAGRIFRVSWGRCFGCRPVRQESPQTAAHRAASPRSFTTESRFARTESDREASRRSRAQKQIGFSSQVPRLGVDLSTMLPRPLFRLAPATCTACVISRRIYGSSRMVASASRRIDRT